MKEIKLLDWFNKIDYQWEKDYNEIGTICYYTKTRTNPQLACNLEDYVCGYGSEQPFFVKSVVDWVKAKSFFEIGTGRGTACMSVALNDNINYISTIDIIPHTQIQNQAIGHKPVQVSVRDLYNMIPYNEKEKIEFRHLSEINNPYKDKFDVCFIDGNHDDYNTVRHDFDKCLSMLKDDGIIIWDDYDPNQFIVKKVVDDVIQEYPEFNTLLVSFRGHMFGEQTPEYGAGEVIMTKRNI